MKKIKFVLVAFCFLLMPMFLFAQTVDPPSVFDISQYFITLGALAAIVTTITQFVKVYIKIPSNITAWLVSLILSVIGWLLHVGIFTGVEWYWILIYAMAAGLVSNGIFDIKIILAILGIIPKNK